MANTINNRLLCDCDIPTAGRGQFFRTRAAGTREEKITRGPNFPFQPKAWSRNDSLKGPVGLCFFLSYVQGVFHISRSLLSLC